MNIQFNLNNKPVSYDHDQVLEFVNSIKDAANKATANFNSAKQLFKVLDLDLTSAKKSLDELKNKISLFEDKALTALFQETLNIIDQLTVPFLGISTKEEVVELLQKQKQIGSYVIYSDFQDPNIIKLSVLKDNKKTIVSYPFSIIGNKFILKTKNGTEAFDSIADFIGIKQKEWECQPQPLALEKPYNFKKTKKDDLTREPYFPHLNWESAIKLLLPKEPGTYLVRDKESDPNIKIIHYKNQSGDISTLELVPDQPPLWGYQCNNVWWPNVNSLIWKSSEFLNIKFKFTPEELEEQQILETPIEVGEIKRNTEIYENFRKRASQGVPLNNLLKEAFESDLPFQLIKWLVLKGAELKTLTATTEHQKAQIIWLENFLKKPEPLPNNIDYYAVVLGYGYKTANIMIQEYALPQLNEQLKGSVANVPAHTHFSDFELREHLRLILPEIESLWAEFQKTIDKEGKELNKEGIQKLNAIRLLMVKFMLENPLESPAIDDWLNQHPSDLLIVRSTGKEDTADNPNPGGNETIPYVPPESLEISKAMTEVISSYFGIKSISQRLLVGDDSLFTELPFMPVLVMKMIMEKINGADDEKYVPRSGVMFTSQTGKAEGVTLLQTGIGNNEGIVSSTVSVDTFYVDRDKHIFSIVRNKKTRRAPEQESGSATVKMGTLSNGTALEKEPALSDAVITDMKITADFFSELYGNIPLDMEYTIDLSGDRPVIHLLQIRPLNEKKEKNPSYIRLEVLEKVPEKQKVTARALLAGASAVTDITRSSDIMFVDNLNQGLTRYLKRSYQTINIGAAKKPLPLPKVIFTKKTSHLTSHEAIFFRKKGVIIFVVDDDNTQQKLKLMAAKASPENPIKVDPQRGILLDTHQISEKENLTEAGYISYPIPTEITVQSNLFQPKKGGIDLREFEVKLGLLNEKYESLNQRLLQNQSYLLNRTLRSLLEIAATTDDSSIAKIALATILKQLNNELQDLIKKGDSSALSAALEYLVLFDHAVTLVDENILPAITSNPGHPNRLFPLKYLEALLFQDQQLDVKNSYSRKKIMSRISAESKMKVEPGIHKEWRLHMQKLANRSLTRETAKDWVTFINSLALYGSDVDREQATKIIIDMVKLNLSSEWINLIFPSLWNEIPNSDDRALRCLKQIMTMNQEESETLAWVKEKTNALASLREQMTEWSKPEYVHKQLLKLRNLYLNDFGFYQKNGKPSLVELYEKSNRLGRLALLSFYQQSVELYDTIIKQVSGSNEYPEDDLQKSEDFARLLIGYLRMLNGAAQFLSKEEEEALMYVSYDNSNEFSDTLKKLEFGVEPGETADAKRTQGLADLLKLIQTKAFDKEKLLTTRPEFNVEPLIIGSHNDLFYGVLWPNTLEEIFTTIHQNLDRIRKHLYMKVGFKLDFLEGQAKDTAEIIQSTLASDLSHLIVKNSKVNVHYQIPLRQHSCGISFSYDVKQPMNGITLQGEGYGKEEHNRWEQTASYGAFLANLWGNNSVLPKINYENPKGCLFTIKLAEDLPKEKLIKIFSTLSYVLKELNMKHGVTPEMIVEQFENILPEKNWSLVNDRFFEQTPYLAVALMKHFSNQPILLAKAAYGTFESLLNYELDDYENKALIPEDLLKGYYRNPAFNYLEGNDGTIKLSAKLTAALIILKGINDYPEIFRPVLNRWLSNAEFIQFFPDVEKTFQQVLTAS